jgi:hypothetical protein
MAEKTETTTEKPAHVLLSEDELRVVLQTLGASGMAGLGEPTLTAEQLALVHTVAQRSLRARRLAQVRAEDGTLMLHMVLLTAVGIALYPEKSITCLCWDKPGGQLSRVYAYQRGEDYSLHSQPEADIHRLSLLDNRERWLEYVWQLTGLAETAEVAPAHQLVLEQTAFMAMQEMVLAGNVAEAVRYLTSLGLADTAVSALVNSLADTPRMVVMQTIAVLPDEEGMAEKHDLSLIQGAGVTWLLVPTPTADNKQPLVIKTCTASEIGTLLGQWLG